MSGPELLLCSIERLKQPARENVFASSATRGAVAHPTERNWFFDTPCEASAPGNQLLVVRAARFLWPIHAQKLAEQGHS